MKRILRVSVLAGLAILVATGCDLLGSAVRPELPDLVGLWEMSEGHPDGDHDYLYLDIGTDGVMRSWYEQGLLEEVQLTRQDNGVFQVDVLKHPYNPESEILKYNIDFRLRGGELVTDWYPDDRAWERQRTFTAVQSIPEERLSYTQDFESSSTGLVRPHDPDGDGNAEWEVTEDGDNSVLVPVSADNNADADIAIAPGDDFTVEFRAKRFDLENDGTSWFAFDLTSFTDESGNLSKWLYTDVLSTVTIDHREPNTDAVAASSPTLNASWGAWSTYRIEVSDGTNLKLMEDGTTVADRTVPYGFIERMKIEGNPSTGLWYFDDLKVTWSP
jgi:hypothetical protein